MKINNSSNIPDSQRVCVWKYKHQFGSFSAKQNCVFLQCDCLTLHQKSNRVAFRSVSISFGVPKTTHTRSFLVTQKQIKLLYYFSVRYFNDPSALLCDAHIV